MIVLMDCINWSYMSCAACATVRSTLCGQSPICAWLVKHVSVRDMFVCFVMYLLVKGLFPTGEDRCALLIMHIYTYTVIFCIQQNGTVKTVIVPDKVLAWHVW